MDKDLKFVYELVRAIDRAREGQAGRGQAISVIGLFLKENDVNDSVSKDKFADGGYFLNDKGKELIQAIRKEVTPVLKKYEALKYNKLKKD